MEDLKRYTIAGVAIAVPSTLAIVLAALAQQQAQQNVLMLTVSGPGTVDIPTGTHSYPGPTEVTVTATPDLGYQANWNLNGIDVEQDINIYSVFVNGLVTLGVYFTPVGPPHGTISGISSVGTVGTPQNLGYYADAETEGIDLAECDEAWTPNAVCAPALMQFKVYDQGKVGIPDIPVNIYPEANPDTTIFKSWAMYDTILSGPFHPNYFDVNSPLILNTDDQGLVSFRTRNLYGAEGLFLVVSDATAGYGQQLSKSTGIYAFRIFSPFPVGTQNISPISKGQGAGFGYVWYGGGGGGPVQYSRRIRAEIVGSSLPYAFIDCTIIFASQWIGHPLLP